MAENIQFCGKDPKIRGFDTFRKYVIFFNDFYAVFNEGEVLPRIKKEHDLAIEGQKLSPCQCPSDHSDKGLLETIIAEYIYKCYVGIAGQGRLVERSINDPNSKYYEHVVAYMDKIKHYSGEQPTVLDTELFVVWLTEFAVMYDLELPVIWEQVNFFIEIHLEAIKKEHEKDY